MRIAIVADWLTTIGGAEHVVRELLRIYPYAHLFTTVASGSPIQKFFDHPIETTRLQSFYRLLHSHQLLLPLLPHAVENIDLAPYDIIISSSHAIAKGIIPPSHAQHLTYCHTPMRYAWEMEEQYLDDFSIPNIGKPIARAMLKKIRRWDLTTAKRTDVFIANSSITAERIQRIYNRKSVIIHPPVDEQFFAYDNQMQNIERKIPYYLAVGRLVPYKRFDLLIHAANALNLHLKIVGEGREEKRLRALAGPTVEFLGHIPDTDLPVLYAGAKALLFPPFEDAGVVPLEAQACGTPVIAYRKGGALDTIIDGQTGLFFQEQTIASLKDALHRFGQIQFDPSIIQHHARNFSAQKFREKIDHIVQSMHESRSSFAQR
ncbi:glycosyltransferase [Candidatus Peregrinibacteria bacterium]|nr:glycosyltransferase [Candidatus Peregrinibacteria bacterium]